MDNWNTVEKRQVSDPEMYTLHATPEEAANAGKTIKYSPRG